MELDIMAVLVSYYVKSFFFFLPTLVTYCDPVTYDSLLLLKGRDFSAK